MMNASRYSNRLSHSRTSFSVIVWYQVFAFIIALNDLQMAIDELLPVAETLQMMRFAEIEGGDIRLTAEELAFANAGPDERKQLFSRHLLTYVPLAAHIRRVLDERALHRAPKSRFADELEDFMTEESADQTLRAAIHLARYAGAFAHDDEHATLSLEDPV